MDRGLEHIDQQIGNVSTAAGGVSNVGIFIQQSALPPTESRCLQSLAFPHMKTRGDISANTEGTCDWILHHHQYLGWLENGGLLWVQGRAGTGKSTLMKHIVDQSFRSNTPSSSSAFTATFFFHRRGHPLQYTPLGLYRSLLHQILSNEAQLLSQFCSDTRFEQRCQDEGEPGDKWEWTEQELGQSLRTCIQGFLQDRNLRLYIDALDESGEVIARSLMKYLDELLSGNRRKLSICVSCRPYPEALSRSEYVIVVENENRQDINAYLRTSFDPLIGIRTRTDITDIISELEERSSGVFQWVVLVTATILSSKNESKYVIVNKIKALPQELGQLYQNMFESLDKVDRSMALPILRWITLSARPLSLRELCYAVATQDSMTLGSSIDCATSENWCKSDEEMENRVRRLSRGLATIRRDASLNGDDHVQFDHESVKNFMTEQGLLFLEQCNGSDNLLAEDIVGRSHCLLLKTCIQHIPDSEALPRVNWRMNPFTDYARAFWMFHAQAAEAEGISDIGLVRLTDWPQSHDLLCQDNDPKGTTLQHLAAKYGLCTVLRELINKNGQGRRQKYMRFLGMTDPNPLDVQNRLGRTPLHYAAAAGQVAAAALLLNDGQVSTKIQDKDGVTPLLRAVYKGSADFVELLLRHGTAAINTKGRFKTTPLHVAAHHGNEAIVRLLLGTGKAGINVKDAWGDTPVRKACSKRHTRIVRILLESGKVTFDCNKKQETLLHAAANSYEPDIVKAVLDTGIFDINAQDQEGHTALHLILYSASHTVQVIDTERAMCLLEVLQDAGTIDLFCEDDSGFSPLEIALCRNDERILETLISTTTLDADRLTSWGNEKLSEAYSKSPWILEARGYDIIFRKVGSTLLHAAAQNGLGLVVERILRTGDTGVNQKDKDGLTPIELASKCGHETIVEMLRNYKTVQSKT